MSRTAVLAATTLLLMAGPALAQTPTPGPERAAASAGTAPTQTIRMPADAATRAAYDRLDPLSRSAFWAQEQAINPADPVAGVRLSQALREIGRYDAAAEAAEATLAVQPDNVEAMLEVGRAHWSRGQAFYGIAALERARDLSPDDWRPWSLLGAAYQQVRRPDDAQAAWNRALELSPDNPAVLTNVAMTHVTAGDLTTAEGLMRRAAAQPGASLQVRQNLAMVLGLNGKADEAEAILRRDLPPEAADRNLEWLSQRRGPQQAGAPTRTWSSLQ
ncbi:tetratricopeptide repeat protein [Rhizobium sp. CRIBSB]|nr:tetratricopeptide repeat protein [Rhizobium sp. CRIBSB]